MPVGNYKVDNVIPEYCIHNTIRGRSQLSTFMKAYIAYVRGRGSGTTVRFPPENQHLFVITDSVL